MIFQSFSNFFGIWTKKEILVVPRLTLTMVTDQWVQWTSQLPCEHWLVNNLTGLWLGHGGWLGAARRRRSSETTIQALPKCVWVCAGKKTRRTTLMRWCCHFYVTGALPVTATRSGELRPKYHCELPMSLGCYNRLQRLVSSPGCSRDAWRGQWSTESGARPRIPVMCCEEKWVDSPEWERPCSIPLAWMII
jgi:hypothetical protein